MSTPLVVSDIQDGNKFLCRKRGWLLTLIFESQEKGIVVGQAVRIMEPMSSGRFHPRNYTLFQRLAPISHDPALRSDAPHPTSKLVDKAT